MRIALLADSFLLDPSTGVNGTQVQMHNLATAFARRGHEVHYLARTRGDPDGALAPRELVLHWVPKRSGPLGWIGEIRAFTRLLRRVDPDVVYQRGRSHLTFVAARFAHRAGRPFVWASNGEDSAEPWRSVRRLRRSPRPFPHRLLLLPPAVARDLLIHRGVRGATRIVAQTETQREAFRRRYGREARVVPSYFPPPRRRGGRKAREVLWLANLGPAKQPELFLELAESCRALPEWRFLLGGSTSDARYRASLERAAARLPNVELLGPVPFAESAGYYERASLFVSTSRRDADGLPNAFIQAWLHGTPVLSLHHDPNGWMEEHGVGWCAHGDRAEFLRRARTALVEAPRASRTCAGFARARFGSEEIVDTHLDLFREARR